MLTAEAYQHELSVSCAAHNSVAYKYWVENESVYGPLTELATSYENQALVEDGVKVDVTRLMNAHISRIKALRELDEKGLIAPTPIHAERSVGKGAIKSIASTAMERVA